MILLLVVIISVDQCLSQKGFPKQFQTVFNKTDQASRSLLIQGLQHLLYDYNNLRARFDILSWRTNQTETYILEYKPKGAEPDSVCQISIFIQINICFLARCNRLHIV